jgi:hypothetical protein
VLDEPSGSVGHGAGNLAPFHEKSGRCLFDLADAAKKTAPCF